MDRRKVVVVEDEPAIRRGVVDVLTMAGYEPIEAVDGLAGLEQSRRTGIDLVLLDLRLPKKDGLQVLAELRKTHPTLPIIILSARGAEDDRVRGLKGGADDYVTKPFSARELLARIEAVMRRSPARPTPVRRVQNGDVTVDLDRREVSVAGGGGPSQMSEMEAAILSHLAANPGRVISRDELLACVWGISSEALETRAIDMHMTRLRAKLAGKSNEGKVNQGKAEADSSGDDKAQAWIVTVRGKGYMLGPNVKSDVS